MLNYYVLCYCFVEFNNKYTQREGLMKRVYCSMQTVSGIEVNVDCTAWPILGTDVLWYHVTVCSYSTNRIELHESTI
jgi:hypothetical protein